MEPPPSPPTSAAEVQPEAAAPERWYEDGLAFDCTACGRCCRDHGEYTFVYVSDKDLQGLTRALGLSEPEFLERFCYEEDGWTVLKRKGDACILLGPTGLCEAYEARPKQCATWPYWIDNLASEEVWENEVKACCPGIGKGEVTSADECDRIARETEDWYEGE